MSDNARFHFSAQDGVLELEGSEDFVAKHLDKLIEIVYGITRKQKETESVPEEDSEIHEQSENVSEQSVTESVDMYPDVLSELNGKLKVVCDIPGTKKRQQMTNFALIYCFGSYLMGNEEVSSKEIRDACEYHGILDGSNYSKTFDDKQVFISDGAKGGIKTIKLTFTGRKKAKQIVEGICLENE